MVSISNGMLYSWRKGSQVYLGRILLARQIGTIALGNPQYLTNMTLAIAIWKHRCPPFDSFFSKIPFRASTLAAFRSRNCEPSTAEEHQRGTSLHEKVLALKWNACLRFSNWLVHIVDGWYLWRNATRRGLSPRPQSVIWLRWVSS